MTDDQLLAVMPTGERSITPRDIADKLGVRNTMDIVTRLKAMSGRGLVKMLPSKWLHTASPKAGQWVRVASLPTQRTVADEIPGADQ